MYSEQITNKNQLDNFVEVTRYVCRFCHREFKTISRHHCKFNPSFHNCFSCKKCTGIRWVTDSGEAITEQEAKEREYIGCAKVFSCASHVDKKQRTIMELSAKNWKTDCYMWEMTPSYTGKNSFLRKMWGIQPD